MGDTKEKQLIVIIFLLFVTCLLAYGIRPSLRSDHEATISGYLESIEGYTTEKDYPLSDEIFKVLDLDDYMSAAYRGSSGRVSLYIGYYYSLAKVSAAHSPTVCFPGQGWNINQPIMKTLVVGDKTINYSEMVASIAESKSLILYWYQAYHLTSPYIYRNKINTLVNKFSGKKEDHAFVRVSVPFTGMTKEEAEKAGIDFIKAFYPKFIMFMDENGKAQNPKSTVSSK